MARARVQPHAPSPMVSTTRSSTMSQCDRSFRAVALAVEIGA